MSKSKPLARESGYSQAMFDEIHNDLRQEAQHQAMLTAQQQIRSAEAAALTMYCDWLERRHTQLYKESDTPPLYTLKQVASMLRHLMPEDPPEGPPVIDTEPLPDPLPFEG